MSTLILLKAEERILTDFSFLRICNVFIRVHFIQIIQCFVFFSLIPLCLSILMMTAWFHGLISLYYFPSRKERNVRLLGYLHIFNIRDSNWNNVTSREKWWYGKKMRVIIRNKFSFHSIAMTKGGGKSYVNRQSIYWILPLYAVTQFLLEIIFSGQKL